MAIIKITFRNETRRVTVPDDKLCYKKFTNLVSKMFEDDLPVDYVFRYVDEDKDVITVSSAKEFEEAVKIMGEKLRFDIAPSKKAKKIRRQEMKEQGDVKFETNAPTEAEATVEESPKCAPRSNTERPCVRPPPGFLHIHPIRPLHPPNFHQTVTMDPIQPPNFIIKHGPKLRPCGPRNHRFLFVPPSVQNATPFIAKDVEDKKTDVPSVAANEPVIEENVNAELRDEKLPATVDIPSQQPDLPFAGEIKQLNEMGFMDDQRNKELLAKFNGDVLQTVRALVE